MRRLSATALAVCLGVGLVAGTAFAGKGIKTSVSLNNPGLGVYVGLVSAKKPCKADRKVTVWHDTNGNGRVDGEPTDFEIGSDLTDEDGAYQVEGNQAPAGDNIIAVVDKTKKGKKRCKGADALTEAEDNTSF